MASRCPLLMDLSILDSCQKNHNKYLKDIMEHEIMHSNVEEYYNQSTTSMATDADEINADICKYCKGDCCL
jgi:hypothetical protein